MDMNTLAAAQTSIKALFTLARVATAATVDHQVKDRLIEIQSGILEAQEKLGDAQSERLELLHLVAELREKVRIHETKVAALASYALHEIEPGKFLYKFIPDERGTVDHFACPTCYNSEKVTVLQTSKNDSQQTLYECRTCCFVLCVGPSKYPPHLPILAMAARQRL